MYYVDDVKAKERMTGRFVGLCAIAILFLFFTQHIMTIRRTHAMFEEDVKKVKQSMQEGDVCAHASDVSSRFDFVVLTDERVLSSPRIKRGLGPVVKAKVIDDKLCDKPIEIFRNASIILSYIPHHSMSPMPKTRKETKLSGEQSVCVQHALDSQEKKQKLKEACAIEQQQSKESHEDFV